jgi:hypothetical protein
MAQRRQVALLQTPFASHNSAALGLIRIKSALVQAGYDCRILHLDHELEAELGEELACDFQRSRDSYWLMELLYASELFPDYLDPVAFKRRTAALLRKTELPPHFPAPDSLRALFHSFNQRILQRWKRDFPYDAVGIGCNYSLMPALFFASAIKEIYPQVKIILGGTQVGGEVGNEIIRTFPFIDWLVRGEGEQAIVRIMNLLGSTASEIPPNCSGRNRGEVMCNPVIDNPVDMEQLPFPDFDDYLASYRSFGFQREIQLPLEIGRGCYYGKCGFCGFNPLGVRYRRMSNRRMVETLLHLGKQYGIFNYVFVDNLMPPDIGRLAEEIANIPYRYRFFLALQAVQAPRVMDALVKMGTEEAFIGIESLSTSILKRMHKGSTLCDNIVALKETVRRGIAAPYFLLTQFPGEKKEEIDRSRFINRLIPHLNMDALDSPFYLHYGCPAQQNPRLFGLQQIRPMRNYSWLLPPRYRFTPTYFWEFTPKLRRKCIMKPGAALTGEYPRLELRNSGPKNSTILDSRSKYREYRITEGEYHLLMKLDHPRKTADIENSKEILKRLMKRGIVIEDCGHYLSLALIIPDGAHAGPGVELQPGSKPVPEMRVKAFPSLT